MARQRKPLFTFEKGEVSPEFLRRADTEALMQSASQYRNAIPLRGGGVKRRPGSAQRVVLGTTAGRMHRYRGRGVTEDLFFYNGGVKVYSTAGSLLQTITTSIPWGASDIDELVITSDADSVYVFHPTFKTQILTYGASGTWARSDFAFLSGAGSKIRQPFFRYEAPGVTMGVSARTGSITVTFSSGFLTSDHVGARFRYLTYNEVEVTAVTNPTTCTCTVKDTIYPAYAITVANNSGYKAGQVCETDLDELSCIVTSTSGGTIVNVVMFGTYDKPSTASANNLVGPETSSAISSVGAASTPPATTVWDESLVSDMRGYAGTGVVHRGRLFMGGFSQATDVVAASAIGALTDFDVGDGLDNEAIVETLGDDPNSTVRFFASAEQLLLFTDRGAYYVPESVDAPITPSTMAFLKIGPEGIAANVGPVVATEGVLFVDQDASRVMIAAPTGRVRRSWEIADLSEAAYHLIGTPKRLAIANGLDGRTERYAFCLNDDGTLMVLMYRRGEQTVAAGKWSRGFGTWEDLIGDSDDVIFVSKAGSDYRLCDLDFDAIIDDEVAFTAAVAARASQEAEVVDTLTVVYSGTLDGTGEMVAYPAAAGLTIGHDFAFTLETAPVLDKNIGFRQGRISRYYVDVLDSGSFRVATTGTAGRLYWPFLGGDDLSTAGKTLTRTARGFGLGRGEAPTLTVSQAKGEGAPLQVRTVTLEMGY